MSSLEAQWPATASPFVPADHWSYRVLRRLDDAGLLPAGADVARRSIPQEEIASLFAYAIAKDSTSAAADYLTAFRREFAAPRAGGITRVDGMVRGYYTLGIDRVRAGVGYDTVWTGARPVDDEKKGAVAARSAYASRYVAGALMGEDSGISELQLVLSGKYAGLWAGRKESGYAAAHGGSIVLTQHQLDGIGFYLPRPITLPVLGPIRFEMQLARIDNVLNLNNEQNDIEPYFWSARGTFDPHPRLRVAVNRGMIFGGKGNYPVTASRVIKNMIGVTTSNKELAFANQMVSADFRYRVPVTVPTALYVEWGADDAYGDWWHTPAIVGGFEVGPFANADIVIGAERTEFAPNRTTNSLWYQNAFLRGGWTDGGVVLGHPLAGHGKEWRAFAAGGWPARGLSGEFAAYTRKRGKQNLLSPQRRGNSIGTALSTDARVASNVYFELQADVEHGTGTTSWTTSSGRAGLRLKL